jgi:hypothetical protein
MRPLGDDHIRAEGPGLNEIRFVAHPESADVLAGTKTAVRTFEQSKQESDSAGSGEAANKSECNSHHAEPQGYRGNEPTRSNPLAHHI